VDLLDRYAASLRARGLSERTVENYTWNLRLIERHCGKRFTISQTAGELCAADVWALLEEHVGELSQAYLRQIVSSAKSWHKWGNSRELWSLNGIMSIPSPKVEDTEPSPLSPEQMLWLITNAWTDRQRKLLYLGGWQGCRIFESARMGEEHWVDDRFSFIGKRNKRREVPIAPALRGARALLTVPCTRRQMRWAYEALRKKSPFSWTPHQLRDTFAQRHIDNRQEIELVGELLGHAPQTTTLRVYGRYPWERKVEAMRDLRIL
jgi:site-specific recombinase XerC